MMATHSDRFAPAIALHDAMVELNVLNFRDALAVIPQKSMRMVR
jgi:hypothetical protein